VSTDVVADVEELERTLLHEADPGVGHTSQAHLQAVSEDAALIVDGNLVSVTSTLEGDVERGTAKRLDGNESAERAGQPEKHYKEGQRAANRANGQVGEVTWNSVLKKGGEHAGDLAFLQGELWKKQLRASADETTVRRIRVEAERTGYRERAEEVLALAP
jgi:hypothetical protein